MNTKKCKFSFRKLAAFVLTLTLALGVMTSGAFAETTDNCFTFSDSGITTTVESGYSVDGTTLTIEASGTYTITGSCSEGSIVVAKGVTGVTLVFRDLELSASVTAPVVVKKNAEVTIVVEGENTLVDNENPDDEDIDDNFEGAAIKIKAGATVTFTGSGTLNIDGSSCKNGIKGGDETYLTFEGGTYVIEVANTAIAANGGITINGGTFDIDAGNDGIKSEYTAEDDNGEEYSLITEDQADIYGYIVINGGSFTIDAPTEDSGDGISAGGNLTITGGTFVINAGDDGIHAEYVTTIGTDGAENGPDITIESSVEGIEGATVNLYSGTAVITSSDDGVNAANGDLSNYSYQINITGGTWTVNALLGDGLDSNGNISISGGTTVVYAAEDGYDMNTALDCDGTATITAGTLLTVDTNGTTPVGLYVRFGGNSMGGFNPSGMGGGFLGGNQNTSSATDVSLNAGDALVIKNSNGDILYETTVLRSGNTVMLAGDLLENDQTYTLYVNGTETATASATEGTSSGGGMTPPGGTNPSEGGMTPPDGTNPGESAPSGVFSDVTPEDWYFNAVMWAAENKITSGMGDGTFVPDTECTRAMFVTFLWNAAGSPAVEGVENPFTDISEDDWYYTAVLWAYQNGITAGTSATTFSPDESCTRAQAVTFLWNQVGQTVDASAEMPFVDVDEEVWYYNAVLWAYENGITAGTTDTTFSPEVTCTRGQLVTFLWNQAGQPTGGMMPEDLSQYAN